MDRRRFLASAGIVSASLAPVGQANAGEDFAVSAGSAPDGPVLLGAPVVSGPSHENLVILQPLQRHATGYLEYAVEDGPLERVDAAIAGLRPFERHVLKFILPPLPPGKKVRYRVTARTIGWIPVGKFVYGRIISGEPEHGLQRTFQTLDPDAEQTTFVVWNDTHENQTTIDALCKRTESLKPDFFLWNGDQSNDIHDEAHMVGQFLAPGGREISQGWPLAYVRGNHDVRGPAARSLANFTGTPNDSYYYAFRSGPLAVLVMDTGEDKADDHPYFAGLAAFQKLREEQAHWLADIAKQEWFQSAPFRVLFCHIPLWWIRDRKNIEWWEYTKACRDVWLPALTRAKVQVVISGHTHSFAWMPPHDGQPIGQLTGGGPQPGHATLIHGTATKDTMTLQIDSLEGKSLQTLTFKST